jgi:hypothetical protein
VEYGQKTLILLGSKAMAERKGFEPSVRSQRQTPADVWSAMEWLADRQDSNGMICSSA